MWPLWLNAQHAEECIVKRERLNGSLEGREFAKLQAGEAAFVQYAKYAVIHLLTRGWSTKKMPHVLLPRACCSSNCPPVEAEIVLFKSP